MGKAAKKAKGKVKIMVKHAAKDAAKIAATNPNPDQRGDGNGKGKSKGKKVEPLLCKTIKKLNHCGMPKYKRFCPSCGRSGNSDKEKLKESGGQDSISVLEKQLSTSISQASDAISHAGSTVKIATSKLSGPRSS